MQMTAYCQVSEIGETPCGYGFVWYVAWKLLLRQLCAGLFADHVVGVPIGPVRIGLPKLGLVLAVSSSGAAKCAGQIGARKRRRWRRGRHVRGGAW